MIELIVGNSYSQIKGLTSTQFADVRQILSYEPDQNAAFFGGFQGQSRKYMIDRKGFFPTGLLSEVTDYLISLDVAVTDARIKPVAKPGMFRIKI